MEPKSMQNSTPNTPTPTANGPMPSPQPPVNPMPAPSIVDGTNPQPITPTMASSVSTTDMAGDTNPNLVQPINPLAGSPAANQFSSGSPLAQLKKIPNKLTLIIAGSVIFILIVSIIVILVSSS